MDEEHSSHIGLGSDAQTAAATNDANWPCTFRSRSRYTMREAIKNRVLDLGAHQDVFPYLSGKERCASVDCPWSHF